MVNVERELSESEIKKIETEGLYSIFPIDLLIGYGVCDAEMFDKDDKKWIRYTRGSSCD